MLSVLTLPGIKLAWAGPISFAITLFSRFTITLVIVLNRTLHRLIGQNWVIFSGLETLPISTRRASFVSCGSMPDSKNSNTKRTTDSFTTSSNSGFETHQVPVPCTSPSFVLLPPPPLAQTAYQDLPAPLV
ncbi:unnamed protein product [Microthlaspi erraticum]|uniref:Uncharacterized protein n=1 Tax=Microthlaspi erraticum TaxID=1685480 RepID=A0A6D2JK45_9BRAS|nr:unnamed protein product [Microthlaspi erraticum]CAA7037251.1 unnamed protein product [Microthlaspi erraticum]